MERRRRGRGVIPPPEVEVSHFPKLRDLDINELACFNVLRKA
jgi:hypothetical protein